MIKFKQFIRIGLIVLAITLIACSNDDDGSPEPEEEAINFIASRISFVDENATILTNNDCINPSLNYFVQIEVESMTSTGVEPTRVDYTFNNELFSVTFTTNTPIQAAITLREGVNSLQLLETGQSATISIVFPLEFEIVE